MRMKPPRHCASPGRNSPRRGGEPGPQSARVRIASRGEDTEASDLDLLVDAIPGAMTLFDLGQIPADLKALLNVSVDVMTPGFLPERVRARVEAEAVPVVTGKSRRATDYAADILQAIGRIRAFSAGATSRTSTATACCRMRSCATSRSSARRQSV